MAGDVAETRKEKCNCISLYRERAKRIGLFCVSFTVYV